MSTLYVAVLAVIVVALLSVAIDRTRRVKTKADYLVAGRSLPAAVLVLTLLTSWIGAGSLFAGAEMCGLLQGTDKPVVLTSRSESVDSKFYSIAMACVMS